MAGKVASKSPLEVRDNANRLCAAVNEQFARGRWIGEKFGAVNSAQNEQRVEIETIGADEVRFRAVADDQGFGGPAELARFADRSVEHRSVGFAVVDNVAAHALVEPRDGAGAVDQAIAPLHNNVRVCTKKRQLAA